jgi:thiamine-monophosphate kinase
VSRAERGETLGDVGEFGVIARVVARLGGTSAAVGPGDDAAVVTVAGQPVVITTDMLVEGRHFRLDWSTPYDVGRKAAAQNFADIAAMGARATALVVALAAPADWPVDDAEALADGLRDEAAAAGATVEGGDLVRSDRLVVCATALGDLDGRGPVLRSGARVGDDVVVVGSLGWSAAGLAALEAGVRSGALVDAHRRPAPPYAAGPALATAGATSMIDVSDGLLADAAHVSAASKVQVRFDERLTPVVSALAAAASCGHADAARWVLTGGEDHALLATVPPGTLVPGGVPVGTVAAGSGVAHTLDVEVHDAGWDHFR